MPTRRCSDALLPLALAALLPLCLSTAATAASTTTRPPVQMATPRGAASPPTTDADRFHAGWLAARGLEGWRTRAGLPDPVSPAVARGGGNPDDAHWQAGFGLPSPDYQISSLMVREGLLVAGGWFRQIGDLQAPAIAAWNGSAWSTLGEFPATIVLELADHPGGLLALGEWADVWQWNGTTWQALGYVPAQYGTDMAVLDDQVAVAAFVFEAGAWRSRVFLHSGAAWTQLGGTFDDRVNALAWYRGELYAAGHFHDVDGVAVRLVVRWDGAAWQPIADGLPSATYEEVKDLVVFNGELVAGGWFGDQADPAAGPRGFARWDGTRWASLGTNVPNLPVVRLRAIGSDLYVVGNFGDHGITRWDGTAWHVDEDSLQAFVYDVAEYQGELYAGGALVSDGPRPASPLVRRRNGRWESPLPLGSAMNGLLGWGGPDVRALVATDGGITVAGRFEFAGNGGDWLRSPGFARWNGTRWSMPGSAPGVDAEPFDLAVHQGVLYASGSFNLGGQYGSLVRLDGETWRFVGEAGQPFLNVYRMASLPGGLYVVGAEPSSTVPLARWDGSSWHHVAGTWTGNYVTAITGLGNEVIVGGDFQQVGGVPCRNVAAWHPGNGWRALGDGLTGAVLDLTARDGVLYAAGASGVSRWKDGHWEPLGAPGYAWSLGWFHDRLIASTSGSPGYLATLAADGTWQPFGSGLNGPAMSLVEHGNSLFVVGSFSQAGGHASYGFAEWREDAPNPPVTPIRLSAVPNPSVQGVSLRYDIALRTRVQVEIHDLNGRLVDVAFDGEQGPGTQDVTWKPDPGRVRPGIYFARVKTGSASRVVRVVRIE